MVRLSAPLMVVFLFASALISSCTESKGTKGNSDPAQLISQSSYYAPRLENHLDGEEPFLRGFIINSRYLLAPFVQRQDGAVDHLVLRETVHLQESPGRERENGRVSVEAFPAARAGESERLWKFESEGIAGNIYDGNLYSVQQAACCGSSERTVQYSLSNGERLFSSTIPVAFIEHAGTRVKRYIGFDDGYGNLQPPEVPSDGNVLGVLYYSSEFELLYRAVLTGKRSRECRAAGTSMSLGNSRSDHPQVTLFRYEATPTFDGIEIIVEMECMADGTKEQCRIPILGDSLDISKATTSAGIHVSLLK